MNDTELDLDALGGFRDYYEKQVAEFERELVARGIGLDNHEARRLLGAFKNHTYTEALRLRTLQLSEYNANGRLFQSEMNQNRQIQRMHERRFQYQNSRAPRASLMKRLRNWLRSLAGF